MNFENLTALYHYFDQLADHEEDDDLLFASSYIRGFIALSASELGNESQPLSAQLAGNVSEQLASSKHELTPQDQVLVNNYWQQLLPSFKY
ncbi:YfcL family protein [Thalassotalea sp. M1531]|uniref:YfcL family protein n=1 Tax=Thalassotalea algicola TaxID=2716224 RepID=A0A7Y0Q6W4_9GAMM|nr:YfcL family protein [Thalassotalea algicola]NMP31247.1 YfcL family protein [Thalassotalea algicola]